MDLLMYARELMINERDRLLGKPVEVSAAHRDLPTNSDPEMSTEELCCIADVQLVKLAKALGRDWYLVIGDLRCLVERARELADEKEQGFF
jgi:hypothetical protein